MEGEALVWKPANQQSLWDSTRLPDQLDTRRDLDDPFPKPPAPQQSSASPAEPEGQSDDSLPNAARKAAAGAAADTTNAAEQPASVPEKASMGPSGGAGGAVSIPYDWAVSIGPDGAANLDGGAGSLTIPGSVAEKRPAPTGAQAPGASGAGQPQAPPASSKGGSSGGNGAVLTFFSSFAACIFICKSSLL